MTDFENAVAAFQKKKNPRTEAEAKREAYKKMVKEYTKLKYGYNSAGERVERPITEKRIATAEAAKTRVIEDASVGLADFFKEEK
jgi:hypothetical protein